jgi:hypothetical protein
MKMQLDTTNKLIKVEGTVNLGEFMEILKKLLPDGKWKEFSIETQTYINWVNPIVINPYEPCPTPWPWWDQTWVVSCDGTTENTTNYTFLPNFLKSGVYNVEI